MKFDPQKIVAVFFVFYLLAIQTSMAGMEMFGALITLAAIFHIVGRLINREPLNSVWSELKIGPDKLVWIFWGLVVFGAFYHPENSSDLSGIIGECRWILTLYGISYWLKRILTDKSLNSFKWIMLLTGLVCIYAVYQSVTGIDLVRGERGNLNALNGWYRATGMFLIPLTFAYSVGQFGLLGLSVSINSASQSKLFRIAGVSTFLLSVVALQSTQVRGSWIAMTMAATVLLALKSRKLLAIVAVLAIISGGVVAHLAPHLAHRVSSIQNTGESSNSKRLNIWRVNWEIAKDHPIIGVGINQNPLYQEKMYEKLGLHPTQIGHSHSDLLQVYVGTGILGLVIYIGIILYFLYLSLHLWRYLPDSSSAYKALAGGLLASQLFVHIGGLTQCNFTDGEVNHVIMLSWSILIAIYVQTRNGLPHSRIINFLSLKNIGSPRL